MKAVPWRRAKTPPTAPNESAAERRAKHIYQVLLILSLLGNGALAMRSQVLAERMSSLTKEKISLETKKLAIDTELLIQKSSPTVIISRVRFDAFLFPALVKDKAIIPFLQNVKDYRVVDNQVLGFVDGSKRHLAASQAGERYITFLLIANISDENAFQLGIRDSSGLEVIIGDLLGFSAVLFPISYRDSSGKDLTATQSLTEIFYEVRSAGKTEIKAMTIPKAVAESWTPARGKLKTIGRAAEGKAEDHLQDIIPKR